jgi:small-conductance mechanosensitive channel
MKKNEQHRFHKKLGWIQVLVKGKQLLLLIRHPPSYSYRQSNSLDQTFNSIFCYIDVVGLSLSNYRLGDYLHRIYVMSLKLRILRILKSLLHHNLVDRYEISICQITMDLLFVYVDAFLTNMLSIKKSNIWMISSCLCLLLAFALFLTKQYWYLPITRYRHLCSPFC